MGSQIAAFGGPDWSSDATLGRNDGRFGKQLGRSNTKGSPIVPGSHLKVAEEGDSIMYAITVLKGHYEAGCVEEDIFTPGECF